MAINRFFCRVAANDGDRNSLSSLVVATLDKRDIPARFRDLAEGIEESLRGRNFEQSAKLLFRYFDKLVACAKDDEGAFETTHMVSDVVYFWMEKMAALAKEQPIWAYATLCNCVNERLQDETACDAVRYAAFEALGAMEGMNLPDQGSDVWGHLDAVS